MFSTGPRLGIQRIISGLVPKYIRPLQEVYKTPTLILTLSQASLRPSLPSKLPLLQSPKNPVTDTTEPKSQRESNIASKLRVTDQLSDRAGEPYLRHAHNSTKDPEAKGENSSEARRQETRVLVDGKVVSGKAAFEEEMFGKGNAFVDGEPIALKTVRC